VRQSGARSVHLYRLLLRLGLSVVGYAGVMAAGALIASKSYETALSSLVAVVVLLLVISLRNSWDLLVSVGEATLRDQST
jgi:hypothetical protein